MKLPKKQLRQKVQQLRKQQKHNTIDEQTSVSENYSSIFSDTFSMGEFMKLLFVSLGCDKILVDSEEMLGLLTSNGFEIVDDETEAEDRKSTRLNSSHTS